MLPPPQPFDAHCVGSCGGPVSRASALQLASTIVLTTCLLACIDTALHLRSLTQLQSQKINNSNPRPKQRPQSSLSILNKMPKSSGSSGKGYDVTSSGTNSQVSSPSSLPQDTCQPQVLGKGNHYDSRDYTSSTGGNQANHNTYHYSNHDGESAHFIPVQRIRVRKEREAETEQGATTTATRTDPLTTTTAMAGLIIPPRGRNERVDGAGDWPGRRWQCLG